MSCLSVGVQSRAHHKRECANKERDDLPQCSRGAESSPRVERVCQQRMGCLISVQSRCRVEPTSREGVPTKRGRSYLSAVEVQSRAHEKRECALKERNDYPQCSRGAESIPREERVSTKIESVPTQRGVSYLRAIEVQSRAHEKRGCPRK